MAAARRRASRREARAAQSQHRWLSQVEVNGVVLSEPVLAEAAPTGFPRLEREVFRTFRHELDLFQLPAEMVEEDQLERWVSYVLERLLELSGSYWLKGSAIPEHFTARLVLQGETLRPDGVLSFESDQAMLVMVVPRTQSLDQAPAETGARWRASPTTRLERLLRETDHPLGLLTNGEQWRIVFAEGPETASWLTWSIRGFLDTRATLDAFVSLLNVSRFFAGPEEETLTALIRASQLRQLDVTDQLGEQAKHALSLVTQELDRASALLAHDPLQSAEPEAVFEATASLIMRLVFLLYAEENGLLPHGLVRYDESYGAMHLLTELEAQYRTDPASLERSFEAYARLLALARMVYEGSVDPDLPVTAHGGRLFSPDTHPLLETLGSDSAAEDGPPRFRDSVMRDLLRSLKYARYGGITQLVSYRTLSVEQIGHMYEALLDQQVARGKCDDVTFLISGRGDRGPVVMMGEALCALSTPERLELVAKQTQRSQSQLEAQLASADTDANRQWPRLTAEQSALACSLSPWLEPHGVARPGGLYVAPGESRRAQGAHYTPPSLTEPVVRGALEPLVYPPQSLGGEPRNVHEPEALLALKVCDPAMGSGAFLVQTVRYLASRLVDAWEAREQAQAEVVLTLPFALPSCGAPDEQLLPATREARVVEARRLVAERCIYGVDRNPLAVEMARLSLWLVTLAAGRSFTFLAHALKYGDCLLGLSEWQLGAQTFELEPAGDGPLFERHGKPVSTSARARSHLAELSTVGFEERVKALAKADAETAALKSAGDLLVGVFLASGKPKERKSKLTDLQRLFNAKVGDVGADDVLSELIKTSENTEHPVKPFHWAAEFPEAFARKNPGFDAFVGNPPFAGKNTLINSNPPHYLQWLQHIHPGAHGNADLVAHFFRRSFSLLRDGGMLGLIATNTIAQGDTRETGLAYIVKHGGTIIRAKRRERWPGQAAVMVSLVHCRKGDAAGPCVLDGEPVERISAFLLSRGGDTTPLPLPENSGLCFQGAIVLGMGFTFDDTDKKGVASSLAEMDRLIDKDSKNAERIFPYIGGAEVNSSPTHSAHRYVINFDQMSEAEARAWPDLMEIAEAKVKPERQRLRDNPDGRRRKTYWWQWERYRPALFEAIESLGRVLVVSRVSQYTSFAFLPAGMVFSEGLVVFAESSCAFFATLQSSVHQSWVRLFSSSMRDDPRYGVSNCFETFPLPVHWRSNGTLDHQGEMLYGARAELMQSRDEGLTKIYNRYHDPDDGDDEIAQLRSLHEQMDEAVVKAYGWGDLTLDYEFLPERVEDGEVKSCRYRWPDALRDEVLGRLLAEHDRRLGIAS